jgi:mxaJ protein
MCSVSRRWMLLSLIVACACATRGYAQPVVTEVTTPLGAPTTAPSTDQLVLHIAADPNNLPFSNERLEGFENKIAQLVADDLGARIEYVWWAQRRGFFRDTLKHGDADVVMGVPGAGFERAAQTVPYYRSAYAFVSRTDRGIKVTSLDDPQLKSLKIGIQLVGATTPPGLALSRRGVIDNVTGYTIYTDYREPNPPARIIDAVVNGEVDVAVVWGPMAGYFAKQSKTPLTVVPVSPQLDPGGVPLAFDICVGVKRSKKELAQRISQVLEKRQTEIQKILEDYGVPIVPTPPAAAARQSQAKGE